MTSCNRLSRSATLLAIAAVTGCGGPTRSSVEDAGEDAGVAADGVNASCSNGQPAMASPEVLAARLSHFIWNEASPSATLVAEVAQANSPARIGDVTSAMLKDPRARSGVEAFFSSWLRLGDLGTLSKPEALLTPQLIASMQKEAPTLGAAVILDGDARYETLMQAPYTYMDETLARHYGVAGVSGTNLQRVSFSDPERIGVLMGAGVLARFSGALQPPWPPRRFWLSYETMLCSDAALPPAIQNSPRNANTTIRQDLEGRTSGQPCLSCHATVNPIGLSFSAFDTFGRYNPKDEAGAPVVTAGAIPAGLVVSSTLTVTSAADMIRQLSKRAEVRRCFSARWLEYALAPAPLPTGTPVEVISPDLACSLDQANAAFEAAGGDIRVLIGAITATPAFLAP